MRLLAADKRDHRHADTRTRGHTNTPTHVRPISSAEEPQYIDPRKRANDTAIRRRGPLAHGWSARNTYSHEYLESRICRTLPQNSPNRLSCECKSGAYHHRQVYYPLL